MSDRLFSFGVIDDDDRTPRERAAKPVRCMEEELLPALAREKKCDRCRICPPRMNDTLCVTCRRIRVGHERSARVRASERLIARAQKTGWVDVSSANPVAVAHCVRKKWLKRASARDLKRLGLREDKEVYLLVSNV